MSIQQSGHDLEAASLEPLGWTGKDQRGDTHSRGSPVMGGSVAHHQGVLRENLKRVERQREHARVRLLDAVFEGQNPGIDELGDSVRREHRAQVHVKITDEGDPHAACPDLADDPFRVRVEGMIGRVGVESVQRLAELRIEPMADEDSQRRLAVPLRRGVDVRQVAGLLQRSLRLA